ncbi:MAG: hypothetical protein IKU81_03150 [Oscillibacter sp.]|nr:hypothetical protein [Oscillibacter sp.]
MERCSGSGARATGLSSTAPNQQPAGKCGGTLPQEGGMAQPVQTDSAAAPTQNTPVFAAKCPEGILTA